MKHARTILAALFVLLLVGPAVADHGDSDSASFPLDLLAGQTNGSDDSGTFSMDLTRVNRDYADSGTFALGGPTPNLKVVGDSTSSGAVTQPWRTITLDGTLYQWQVLTADTMPVGDGPLSDYAGQVLGIAALDSLGEPITDPEQLRSAFIVTENASSLSLSNFNGGEESIPLNFAAAGITTTDDQGTLYHIDQSLVSDSTGSTGEFLEFNTVSGFGDRSTRRELWKQAAMEVALQHAIFARMNAGDDAAEAHRQNLYDHAAMVVKGAGQAETTSELLDKLEKFGKIGLDHVAFTEIVQNVQGVADDLGALQARIVVVKRIDARRTAQLKSSFSALFGAFNVAGTVTHYTGEVAEALMLQAIARAQGEERLLVLQELALAGAFYDPAAVEGINDAVAEYDDIKDSFYEAWAYIRSSNTPLQTVDEITDLIQAGMSAGTLFNGLFPQTASAIAQKLPFLASNGTKVFGRCLGAAGSALSIALSIDSALKTMRQADIALTMERQIKSYLQTHAMLGTDFASDNVLTLMSADQMRHYLAYWHFEKCLNIIKAEWYDFYKIVLLDPIGGLIWLQGILNSKTMEDAVNLYESQKLQGIQNAIRYLDDRGRMSPDLWNRFDQLLNRGVDAASYEELIAIDLSSGQQKWVRFETSNFGGTTSNASISISVPDGVFAVSTDTAGLPGTWETYTIGVDEIWHRDDTTFLAVDTLYEYEGAFPEYSTHWPGLLLQATRDGTYWLRARVAMLPEGSDPGDQSAYVRYPGSGQLDQQGWECLEIDVTSGVDPCPSLTVVSPTSPVSVMVGEAVEIELLLENPSGCAPSVQTYVDVSHDAGVSVESLEPFGDWERYLPGELIWNSAGQQMTATKTLWSQATGYFAGGHADNYVLRVRPTTAGTFGIYVRSAMHGPGMTAGTFVRSPDSGPVDQQGWPVHTIVVQAAFNQPPVLEDTLPVESLVTASTSELVDFDVTASDADGGPQPLSYTWYLDGSEQIGDTTGVQVDTAELAIGEHTISVSISDGVYNVHHEWQLVVAEASALVAELNADVPSRPANLPDTPQQHVFVCTVNVTDPAGNSSFSYSWSAPVNPSSGRSLALVSGGDVADATATYASPVLPPETTNLYAVNCIVTGDQTEATAVVSTTVQVLPPVYLRGDMDCNGVIEMADVPLFVEALLDPIGFDAAHPNCDSSQADVDGSGGSDGGDITEFVTLLAL